MRNRVVTIVAAVAIAVGGYLHWKIWDDAYRHAPVREMFLINVGLSAVLAIALLLRPTKLIAAGGFLLAAGSLVAFALSRGPGLPTFHGKFTETGLQPHNVQFLGQPAAVAVLVAEALAVICCLGLLVRRTARTA